MRIPQYTSNGDGRAYVRHRSIPTVNHRLWLGKYGSEESLAEYERFIRRLRENEARETTIPTHRFMTVVEIAFKYFEYIEAYYGVGNSEFLNSRNTIASFAQAYGERMGNEVGPRMLLDFREMLVREGMVRTTINQRIGRVKRMFKWACAQEFIPPETFHRLSCIEGLRQGRSAARESKVVRPVAWEHFQALLPFMPPPVRAMSEVQYYCGMRPGEACLLRGRDLDMEGEIWLFLPEQHKGTWKGLTLAKAIPKVAQEIIRPFLRENPDEYLFRPEDGRRWFEQGSGVHVAPERKTKVYPSELKRRAEEKAKAAQRARKFRERYYPDSYWKAVKYAFETAEKNGVRIPHWHPNQLRHAIATQIRKTHGQQQAQLWLGHRHLNTTGIYAEKQIDELVDLAKSLDQTLPSRSIPATSICPTGEPVGCTTV